MGELMLHLFRLALELIGSCREKENCAGGTLRKLELSSHQVRDIFTNMGTSSLISLVV